MKGLSTVLRNLNREVNKIREHTKAGLWEAALTIKRESMLITPYDLGNLVGSCFVTVTDWKPDTNSGRFTGDDAARMASDHQRSKAEMDGVVDGARYKYSATVAYSAHYAFYVHEMTGEVNWNSPRTGSQYLLRAVNKTKGQVARIIAKHASF